MADPDVGDRAPPFELPNQDGEMVSLMDFEGQPLVLYFYPGDFTPGCTSEACSFRDAFEDLRDLDAAVVGVSEDPPDSHADFRRKHELPFDLLSDVDGRVAEAYGADGFFKTRRVTFVIDGDGVIRERIASFLPGPHVSKALDSLPEVTRA